MRPDEWQQVWGRLRQRALQIDPGVAPAWWDSLRRWPLPAVLAAIDRQPPGPVDYVRLMNVLDPPPPPWEQALVAAKAVAEEADVTRSVDEGPAPVPTPHPAVMEAAATAGFGWLRAVDPSDVAACRRWRDVYDEAARRHSESR